MSEFPKPIDLAHRVLDIETTAIDTAILARAVLAQHEEIERLRADLLARDREIDRIAHGETIESDAMCINEVEVVNLRGEVERMRAVYRAACEWSDWDGSDDETSVREKLDALAAVADAARKAGT